MVGWEGVTVLNDGLLHTLCEDNMSNSISVGVMPQLYLMGISWGGQDVRSECS